MLAAGVALIAIPFLAGGENVAKWHGRTAIRQHAEDIRG
jgi:hypothetical protein